VITSLTIPFRSSIAAIAWLLFATVAAAQNQPRIALIITNQNYALKELELQNPHADGEAMKAALEAVGFDVTVVRDTKHLGALENAIGQYVARLADAGPDAVGFFYYSGHGAADGPRGSNYLLPTGALIEHAAQLRLSALSVEHIVNALSQTGGKMNFVVFDACRNVPLRGKEKANYKGFAPYRDAPGMLIAYATEPGDVAADKNFYSRALAEEIVRPNREAGSVFRSVSRRVYQATAGRQRPVPIDKRFDDFYFKQAALDAEKPSAPKPAPSPQAPLSEAARVWGSIKDTTVISTLEAFRAQFGSANPLYDQLAEQRIQALKQNEKSVAVDMQRELKRIGCYTGQIDGEWGPRSKSAVTELQTAETINLKEPMLSSVNLDKLRKLINTTCKISAAPTSKEIIPKKNSPEPKPPKTRPADTASGASNSHSICYQRAQRYCSNPDNSSAIGYQACMTQAKKGCRDE
jgi:uncharacterized caspase-like protein